jgi:hypothetical protein
VSAESTCNAVLADSNGVDQHYWAFLIVGKADTITIAQNYIKNTSGLSSLRHTASTWLIHGQVADRTSAVMVPNTFTS